VAKRPPLTAEENATIQLFNSCCDSVCNVTNLSSQRGPFSTYHDEAVPQGAGSGFVWDAKGHIVTNFHVIQGASQLGVTLAGCPKPFAATLVGCDPERDIAVLRILAGRKLRPLPIGTSNDLQVGQKVIAIGNPFGLDHVSRCVVAPGSGRIY
jgi:S1-C subfamily serine protease